MITHLTASITCIPDLSGSGRHYTGTTWCRLLARGRSSSQGHAPGTGVFGQEENSARPISGLPAAGIIRVLRTSALSSEEEQPPSKWRGGGSIPSGRAMAGTCHGESPPPVRPWALRKPDSDGLRFVSRSHRLEVRTPGSQPGNGGSSPPETASQAETEA
jgi:hypothetical protein